MFGQIQSSLTGDERYSNPSPYRECSLEGGRERERERERERAGDITIRRIEKNMISLSTKKRLIKAKDLFEVSEYIGQWLWRSW